jgi:ACT domain-containing protein
MAVARLKSCDNIVALARDLGVHRRLLYKWQDQLEPVEQGEEPVPSSPEMRQQVRQLKRLLAEKTMSRQGSLSIERMCQLVQVSRAGFYRSLGEQGPVQEEMEVRSAIQQIAVEHRRRYGYRRISAELRRRAEARRQRSSSSGEQTSTTASGK